MSFDVTTAQNVIIVGATVQLPVDKQSQEIAFDPTSNAEIIEGTIIIGTALATLVAQINAGTVTVSNILSPVTVQGTVIVGTIQVPEIVNVATISNAPLITVQGSVSSSITNPINVATILNAPLVTVQGNVVVSTILNSPSVIASTILNAPLITVQGSVSSSITNPINVATILNAPLITVGTVVNPIIVSTILTPSQVVNNQNFKQTNILTNAVVTSPGAATLTAGAFQDLVVDVVYGTVISGSIQTAVVGVEPQSGVKTSTIVAGAWFAGTLVTGQRIVASGPLGALVAVIWNVPAASTITGVFITAEQSTSL